MDDVKYVVVKPFKTPTRRFKEGAEVMGAEIDGPLTAGDWQIRGFLDEVSPPAEIVPVPAPVWADPPTT